MRTLSQPVSGISARFRLFGLSSLLMAMVVWVAILAGTAGISHAASLLPANGMEEVTLNQPAENAPYGPRIITVSLDAQELRLFQGLQLTASSRISSGKSGHETPMGVYSILEKRRYHESNLYSNAPMPYMQRLTWSGIALHESSHVPSWPASHGCVRLPGKFAKSLFSMTQRGMHVVISRELLTPRSIRHDVLFQPRPAMPELAALRSTISGLDRVRAIVTEGYAPEGAESAQGSGAIESVDTAKPLRIYISRITRREITQNMQDLLNRLGYDAGEADGLYGMQTVHAVKAFQENTGLRVTGTLSDDLLDALYAASGSKAPLPGILHVRRAQRPVFSVPVDIREPQKPLGTHLFIAMADPKKPEQLEWIGLSPATRLPGHVLRDHEMDPAFGKELVRVDAVSALNRLEIDQETRDRIASMIADGASVAVSDNGLGTETGKGTDFIVQLR